MRYLNCLKCRKYVDLVMFEKLPWTDFYDQYARNLTLGDEIRAMQKTDVGLPIKLMAWFMKMHEGHDIRISRKPLVKNIFWDLQHPNFWKCVEEMDEMEAWSLKYILDHPIEVTK